MNSSAHREKFWTTLAAVLLTAVGLLLAQVHDKQISKTVLPDLETAVTAKSQSAKVRLKPIVAQARASSIEIPILMYHHVGNLPDRADTLRRDLTVSSHDFAREISWLRNQGFQSISLHQLYLSASDQFILPAKPIILTFDDGYSDVFDNAAPILLLHGFTGSFAIITQFVGRPDYASWGQIRAAEAQGMEMVSHTRDHFDGADLHKYSRRYIYDDLLGSRTDFEAALGHSTDILIYPYGHTNAEYKAAARQAGFVMGLTVNFGKRLSVDDLMDVPRVRVHGGEDFDRFKKILLEP